MYILCYCREAKTIGIERLLLLAQRYITNVEVYTCISTCNNINLTICSSLIENLLLSFNKNYMYNYRL